MSLPDWRRGKWPIIPIHTFEDRAKIENSWPLVGGGLSMADVAPGAASPVHWRLGSTGDAFGGREFQHHGFLGCDLTLCSSKRRRGQPFFRLAHFQVRQHSG